MRAEEILMNANIGDKIEIYDMFATYIGQVIDEKEITPEDVKYLRNSAESSQTARKDCIRCNKALRIVGGDAYTGRIARRILKLNGVLKEKQTVVIVNGEAYV